MGSVGFIATASGHRREPSETPSDLNSYYNCRDKQHGPQVQSAVEFFRLVRAGAGSP